MFRFIIILLVLSNTSCAATGQIESTNNLFAFVGEQVDIKEVDNDGPIKEDGDVITISLDSEFKAKYKILEPVFGKYGGGEIIEFTAFDHYGFPDFAKFKTALIFVSEHDGDIYHQKYQFYDVYMTKSGRWAACGEPDDYINIDDPKPLENITFKPPVYEDLTHTSDIYANKLYEEPIYEIQGNKAVCKQGVFVDELFRIKKETVLKARGVFE